MRSTGIHRAAAGAALLTLLAGPAAADPALWRLADGDSTIYLFGTVHVLPPEVSWRREAVMAAFAQAETVWFEAPAHDPAAQNEVVALTRDLGLNPPGRPLSAQISAEARAALAALESQTGLPSAGLEPFRPWLAAMTLTMAFIQARGYDPQSGVESVLWPGARAAGKMLAYFETIEEQFRFLADLPPEIEVRLFEQTLREFQESPGQLDALVDAWSAGDLALIDRLVNGEMRAVAPEVHETLIVQRNLRWVRQIRELLDGAGVHFIALGAGHLVGPQGVIELLRAEGMAVEGP